MNGLYVDTGKKCPTTVMDSSGCAPWQTGQNHVPGTPQVHGRLDGPVNGLYGDTGKKCPMPVVDERHGKLGKTTYVAHAAYTDPYTDP